MDWLFDCSPWPTGSVPRGFFFGCCASNARFWSLRRARRIALVMSDAESNDDDDGIAIGQAIEAHVRPLQKLVKKQAAKIEKVEKACVALEKQVPILVPWADHTARR